MRILQAAFILTTFCANSLGVAQQTTPAPKSTPGAAPATAPPASAPKPAPLSNLVQPSLDALQATLASVKLEKWKGGSVRNEAAGNIASIQKDLQATLPGLLKDADAAPVSRNLGALYDVLMRVWDGARVAAPAEQVELMQQAMMGIDKSRRAVDDRLASMAASSEKQVGDLQIALAKVQSAPVCPVVAPPPPPPAPAPKKKVVKKKPATPATAKPTTPQPATPAPATTKPNS